MNYVSAIFHKLQSRLFVICVLTVGSSYHVLAQDKKIDVDIGINREPVWYQQPWTWIVGAAIFVLLLVALLRGGKKK